MDSFQQIDHAEHDAMQPCPDCGGPQYDGEHREDCPRLAPTIAERRNPRSGRTEFRAYPNGIEAPGGGAGPWTPDRAAAEHNLTAALAVDAEDKRIDYVREQIAQPADWREAVKVRDAAHTELWRNRDKPDSDRYRRALAIHTVARAELARRSKDLTGYNSVGQTATLGFLPGGRGGDAWVSLDRDPGTGSMTYADSLESWTITGGPIETLRDVVEHYQGRVRQSPWLVEGDTPGAQHSAAWLADVEALADDAERTGRD